MKSLVLDTSNKYLIVALYQDDNCIYSFQQESLQKQSEYAIIEIQNALNKTNLNMLDLNEVIITIGPGSYTGVRVALTIAKTLSATTNIKIKTISSLHSLVGLNKGISILDARSKKIYVGIYDNEDVVKKDTIISIDEFEDYIKGYEDINMYGDTYLVNKKSDDFKIYENMYELSKYKEYEENEDILVPQYIKDDGL